MSRCARYPSAGSKEVVGPPYSWNRKCLRAKRNIISENTGDKMIDTDTSWLFLYCVPSCWLCRPLPDPNSDLSARFVNRWIAQVLLLLLSLASPHPFPVVLLPDPWLSSDLWLTNVFIHLFTHSLGKYLRARSQLLSLIHSLPFLLFSQNVFCLEHTA